MSKNKRNTQTGLTLIHLFFSSSELQFTASQQLILYKSEWPHPPGAQDEGTSGGEHFKAVWNEGHLWGFNLK